MSRKPMSAAARRRISAGMKRRYANLQAEKDRMMSEIPANTIAEQLQSARDEANFEMVLSLTQSMSFISKKRLVVSLVESMQQQTVRERKSA